MIFDFNVHLCRKDDPFETSVEGMRKAFKGFLAEAPPEICGANIMVFNSRLVFSGEWERFQALCEESLDTVAFSLLFDFRNEGSELFRAVLDLGFRAVKFHSLAQRIDESEFPAVLRWAEKAAAEGLLILVDTSIGTPAMYRHDGLRLAAFLIENLKDAPIVLLHSGGLRVMEALLLAVDSPGIFLETSFSLPYYRGSRLEEDFAFVYRKLGAERVIYGSDHPFVPAGKSLEIFRDFFERNGFSPDEMKRIFYENALWLVTSEGQR